MDVVKSPTQFPINCVNCREYWKYDSHCGLTGNVIPIVHWDFGDYGDDEKNCPLTSGR